MKPKLILHAGTHKTGTTTIQSFAALNCAALAARGVFYPDLTPLGLQHDHPQHAFAHALADKDKTLSSQDAARVAKLWAEAAAGSSVLISSEPLYRHSLRDNGSNKSRRAGRARYLDRLAEVLAPFEVEVVLTFRRPEDFVRSLFQENMMRTAWPNIADFADFRAHALRGALRYGENAELFSERFGGAVRCLVYEDFPKGAAFCPAFFAQIGINAAGFESIGTVRESLGPLETQLKIFIGQATGGKEQNATLLKWAKSSKTTSLAAKQIGDGPFSLWESADARATFAAAAAPEVERLRARFFPDRAELFAPDYSRLDQPVPAFSPELEIALLENYRRTSNTAAKPVEAPAPEAESKTPDAKARRHRKFPKPQIPAATHPIPPTAPIENFVLIIGAMKSGTTSLYHYLITHPRIAACRTKEPDFFANSHNWNQGPSYYYGLWPEFDPSTHRFAIEASTNYTKFPRGLKAPNRIRTFARKNRATFKLIYIMRNPIDRIESHLAHNIARSARRISMDMPDIGNALSVSSYAKQLSRFAAAFPPEDLLLLNFDDLRTDSHAVIRRCLDFLGLEPIPDFEIRPPVNTRRDRNGSAEFQLDPAQREVLRVKLREDMEELRDRFGFDVGKWDIL